MNSKDLLVMGWAASTQMLMPLLEDLRDEPLAFPTANGGNHALWIAGHMAYSEGNLYWNFVQGKPNPVEDWKDNFNGGTEPSGDKDAYPSYDEVLAKYGEIHEQVIAQLNDITEEQLDAKCENVPPEFAAFFGTARQCFLIGIQHMMMHRGQLADCRRALGRKPIMA